jgi:hypothetical protein
VACRSKRCREVDAAVDLGETLIHFPLQHLDLPLQAFLHADDQLFEVVHVTLIVHPVYVAHVL